MDSNISIKTSFCDFNLVCEKFDDFGFSICLPDFLDELTEEEIVAKFTETENVLAARADIKCKVGLTLSAESLEVPETTNLDDYFESLFYHYEYEISQSTSNYERTDMQYVKNNEYTLTWLSYRSSFSENDIYNVFFFALLDNILVSGTFSCLFDECEEWKLVFLICLNSFKSCPEGSAISG